MLKRHWSAPPFQQEDLWLRSEAKLSGVGEIWLIKPTLYMNRSGIAVRALLESQPLDARRDLLIVVDDVALEPGQPRFRARGSAGNHNGLQSIEDTLDTREYARLRIGVGGAPPGVGLSEWVLSEFDSADDEDAVIAALPRLAAGVELWAREGIDAAMNRYNAGIVGSDSSDDE